MTADNMVVAEGLTKTFSNNGINTTAYTGLDFNVRSGEFFCLLGPSGCGKSTVLNSITGLTTPSSGRLVVGNNASAEPVISMVFQEHGLFPWMTLQNNIGFPLKNKPGMTRPEIERISSHYLDKVGLRKFAGFYPHQVSGGMRQRISIARSFALNPDILLMDEPFVYLDYQNRLLLQETLLQLWQETGKTILFVTHNINEAVSLADTITIMTAHPGKIKANLSIDIERPRDMFEIRKTKKFNDYVANITDLLKDEMRQTQEQAAI